MNQPDTAQTAIQWWSTLGVVGWCLVFLGCALEGIAEFTKSIKNESRRHATGKVGWLILLIGLAVEFWAVHRESALKDTEIARMGLESSRAQLELANLKKAVQWREITSEQKQGFARLAATSRRFPVKVISMGMNPEAIHLGGQYTEMLTAAGYSATHVAGGMGFLPGKAEGVIVATSAANKANPGSDAAILAATLNAAGLAGDLKSASALDGVEIWVMAKP